jgi:hypothetical protein
MSAMSTEWNHATQMALEAYEIALRSGSENGSAVAVALTRMRTVVPTASESDVRQALALLLAAQRMTLRSEPQRTPTNAPEVVVAASARTLGRDT